MKRGNTALKRGVGLASAFALAIAGAVVAAPAASAAAIAATPQVRATPAVDAPYIADPGHPIYTATYADTDGDSTAGPASTGALPVVTVGSGQVVSGVQIAIPVGQSAGAGAAFDATKNTFDLVLSGAAFTNKPTATITGMVDLGSLTKLAGHAGTNASAAPAVTTGVTNDAPGISTAAPSKTNNDSDTVTFTLTKPSQATDATVPTGAGYLINITGVRVSVADGAQPGPINATVKGTGTNDVTTIGYVAPFKLSIASDAGYPANVKGDISLPDITVTETSKKGFQNSFTYGLAISGTAATGTTFGVASDGSVTPSSSITINSAAKGAKAAALAGPSIKLAAAGVDDTALESLTFSGVEVENLKAGADIKVGLTVADATATPANVFKAIATGSAFAKNSPDATSVLGLTISETTQPPRTAGNSRYATAGIIAGEYGVGTTVVLANGIDNKLGIDALAANYLAGATGSPILLTDSSNTLPDATRDALAAHFKGQGAGSTVTVYIMGKTDSVSAAAEAQAKFVVTTAADSTATVKVVRLDGADRYKTAALALDQAGSGSLVSYDLGKGSRYTAFLASGQVNADALAAGALSAGAGIPVVLTNGTAIDSDLATQISDLNITQFIVLGSTDRVSAALVDSLTAAGNNVVRVAGTGANGRFDTASALNTLAIKGVADQGLGVALHGTAYLANGLAGFPDALTVGPLAGKNTNPLLTVPENSLPDSTKTFLSTNKSVLTDVSALGKSDRIADSVITAAQQAIL